MLSQIIPCLIDKISFVLINAYMHQAESNFNSINYNDQILTKPSLVIIKCSYSFVLS